MAQYLSRLARAVLVTTCGFGGGVALLVFIFMVVIRGEHNAALDALKAGLTLGVCFSMMLMAVMVLLDLTAKLFVAKGLSNNFWDLEQRRQIVFEGTPKQILAACRQALLCVPNITSVSEDPDGLKAKAYTGASWRSGGEELEVEILPAGERRCCVLCKSHSKSKDVVFDYGKNFENVETWRRQMDVELKALSGKR